MPVPVVANYTSQISSATAASITLTKPSGVNVGDLLALIVISDDNTATISFNIPTGWTGHNPQAGGATPDAKAAIFTRVADGTEGATQEVTFASGSDWANGWYLCITGADTEIDPIGNYLVAIESGNTTSFPIQGITTTEPNVLAIAVWSYDGADTTFSVSGSWGTTIPAEQTKQSPVAGNTTGSEGGWLTKDMPTIGDTGDCVIGSTVGDGFSGFMITINALPVNIMSGTVTLAGTPVEGAAVTGFYADDTNGTNPRMRRTVLTDVNGDWMMRYPEGRVGTAVAYWDDGGTFYSSTTRPFIEGI